MDRLQAVVLKALLTKVGWAEYADLVSADVLTNSNVRAVYAHIQALHGRSDIDLSSEALRLDIQATYRQGESRSEELCEVVSVIESAPEVAPNALRDSVQKFVQRELLATASRQIATHLQDEVLDVASIAALVTRAVEVGESVNTAVLDALDADLSGQGDDRPGISGLGFGAELDNVLGGGVAAGELLLFIAPPARGKTSYLCAAGARASAAGRKVLHITLEISARRVNRRYDSVWTGLARSDMAARPGAVNAARASVRRNGGAVIIKDWSYSDSGTTAADVKGLVRRLRGQGIDIDIVIVDYLELMRPNRGTNMQRREQRHVYGQQVYELRAAAVALGLPILSAWQINRVGAEVDSIEMTHVSECWDAVKHADILLSLNQSKGERDGKMMRVGVLKQRDSEARPQITVWADLDRCQIRDTKEGVIHVETTTDGLRETPVLPGSGEGCSS